MHYNGQMYHQGDVQVFGMESIPPTARKVEKRFFAKSEKSGHVHALCGNYELYEDPQVEGGFYVRVFGEGAVLNHTLEANTNDPKFFDSRVIASIADHRPIFFKPGVYRVGIQRRFNPFDNNWERVMD
ncbi:MAG: hypothetical protein ACK4XY_06365 [Chloroherpetonaceae bacterium]